VLVVRQDARVGQDAVKARAGGVVGIDEMQSAVGYDIGAKRSPVPEIGRAFEAVPPIS
jgi:hypothetical protein